MLHVPFYAALMQVSLLDGPFPDTDRAVDLLLGTCAQESAFTYCCQLGGGPAKGYMQCEPATETDIWVNYLAYHSDVVSFLAQRCGVTGPDVQALEHNMVYQILLARVHYLRCDPARLPEVGDLSGQARSWKTYYNTPAGHGTEAQYIDSYETLVRPYLPGFQFLPGVKV